MKERIVKQIKETVYNNKKYTVMVLGALNEVNEINGFYIVPVTFNGKNNKVRSVEYDRRVNVPGYNEYYARTKTFNMGWAICNSDDVFSEEVGETICRRRFSKSPMKTQNGRFLTKDMCQAIVDNEVDYIINHISEFLPKYEVGDVEVDTDYIKDFVKDTLDKIYSVRNKDYKKLFDSNKVDNKNIDEVLKDFDYSSLYKNPYPYVPTEGEYISFTHEGQKYVGIYKTNIPTINGKFSHRFYFLGPVNSDNGLIEHDKADVFITLTKDEMFDFKSTTPEECELINAYLKGARNYVWIPEHKSFRLVF
jgi:hypothetical protein